MAVPLMLALSFTGLALAAPADGPRVVSVENGGLLFTDNQAGVSGTDAGYSLPLGDRTLWLFGDVFLLEPTAPTHTYVGAVSNCGLTVARGSGAEPLKTHRFLTDPATGLARQLIPKVEGEGQETCLWPLGGWYDSVRQRAFVYYGIIQTTGEGGPFGFRTLGHGLARASTEVPDDIQFERLRAADGGWEWWPDGGTVFGAAVVTGPDPQDPFIYLVGTQERGMGKVAKLARVPKERIENLAAYEYLTGTAAEPRWGADLAEAADVEGLADYPSELSVAYNEYLGGYLAVHSVLIDQRLRLSLAPEPWGPYRQIGEIGAPHRAFESAFCYAGKEHPELSEDGGRVIYVTYVDSQRYWLQLLKVTLAK